MEERKEGGEEGKLESVVLISQKTCWIFRVFMTYYGVKRAADHDFYVFFFMCLFIFIKSLFLPGKFKYSPQ